MVDLTLMRGKDEFRIVRARNHYELGTCINFYINGDDISGKTMKETDSVIQKYIPEISWNIVSSIIVLGQGLPNKLTGYSPSGRKQLLEDLSKTSHLIEEVRARLDSRKYTQNELYKSLSSKVSSLRVESTTLEGVVRDLKSKMSYTEEEVNSDLEKLNKEISDLKTQSKEYESDEQDMIEVILEKNKAKDQASQVYNNLHYERQTYTSKISKLSNNVCPTCGRPFENSNQMIAEKEQAQVRLSEIITEMSVIKSSIDQIESEISEMMMIKSNISSLRSKVDSEIITLSGRLGRLESVRDSILTLKTDIETYNTKISKISKEIAEINPQIASLELSLKSLSYLDRSLSKEFKSYLLESVIDYLNDKIKRYSKVLFSDDYVKFLSSGNNLDIVVGESKTYESLSGGERQKADLCVQFALRDMLVDITGFSCNILVLDEIFDNLDNTGCESLLTIISDMFSDINSVFVITHHNDIQIPKDKEIIVTKDFTNISTIEVIE